ncbi:MAG TPA: zinc ABC transporter substrate-binding protein, partial [Rhizobium sp.]|nr:zinc ABC transporter substrate-binding protein [Rhizobium sp.]
SLKPSNARALENADVVFWVGPGLEAFLEKPVDALAGKAKVVELEDAPGLVRLPFREGGAFEAHDHEGE